MEIKGVRALDEHQLLIYFQADFVAELDVLFYWRVQFSPKQTIRAVSSFLRLFNRKNYYTYKYTYVII